MSDIATAALALRLLAVSVVVLLLPGFVLVTILRAPSEWHQRVVYAFALSYAWIFVLSIVVPLLGWTIDHAALLEILVIGGGAIAVARRRRDPDIASSPRYDAIQLSAIAVLVIVCAAVGWMIEPPFTGEEALDLVSISRFADGGPITFENTSLFPDTRPVYLFQPYQMAIGMIARWSGTDPLIAFMKFRSFLAPLTMVFLYSLLRRFTRTRIEAAAAFVVVLLFVAFDLDTWESNSLFPFVRRGGFSAGVLVPALLMLSLAATRRAEDPAGRTARRVALITAPILLVAGLSTHPLEMFPLLCFVAGIAVAGFAGIDRSADRKRVAALVLLLSITTGGYLTLHAHAVRYIAEYEWPEKLAKRQRLAELLADPFTAVVGPSDANDMFIRTLPATTATVFGIPAIAIVAARAPVTAALLALGIVPLALVGATPAGFVLVQLLTSADTVKDVDAYFALLGLISVALAAVTLAHAALHAAAWRRRGFGRAVAMSAAGSMVLWIAWTGGRGAVSWFTNRLLVQPELLLVVAVIATGVALTSAVFLRRPIVSAAPFPHGLLIVAACLAVPMICPEWAFGDFFTKREPTTVFDRLSRAHVRASVFDWRGYYEHLPTFDAALQPPATIVDELRHRLPPRQVMLAHPHYSCALVTLIDAYCVNPETIHGHYFLPAGRYHSKYLVGGRGARPEHPFFNESVALSDAEDRLLADYRVSYILADPEHAEQIGAKLRAADVKATLELDRDGYRLYRISDMERPVSRFRLSMFDSPS